MNTTRSASATVVEVALVLPSMILSSVVVLVTPSKRFNSAVVDVTPSRIFNSSGVEVTAVALTAARTGNVPDTFGRLIVLSAVGSTTVSVVSWTSAVAPSNTTAFEAFIVTVLTCVVVPVTVRLPATARSCEITISPSASICIALTSLAEPMSPPSGITMLPPVVINPPPVYVPLTSRLALISASVALISISSVAVMSRTVALGALINCEASLNCNAIVLLRRRPASGICVRITS